MHKGQHRNRERSIVPLSSLTSAVRRCQLQALPGHTTQREDPASHMGPKTTSRTSWVGGQRDNNRGAVWALGRPLTPSSVSPHHSAPLWFRLMTCNGDPPDLWEGVGALLGIRLNGGIGVWGGGGEVCVSRMGS